MQLLSQYLIIFLCSNAFHFRMEFVLKLQFFWILEKDAIYNWMRPFQFLKGAVMKECAPYANKLERYCGYHLQLCTIIWWSIRLFHVILRKKSALPNTSAFSVFIILFPRHCLVTGLWIHPVMIFPFGLCINSCK